MYPSVSSAPSFIASEGPSLLTAPLCTSTDSPSTSTAPIGQAERRAQPLEWAHRSALSGPFRVECSQRVHRPQHLRHSQHLHHSHHVGGSVCERPADGRAKQGAQNLKWAHRRALTGSFGVKRTKPLRCPQHLRRSQHLHGSLREHRADALPQQRSKRPATGHYEFDNLSPGTCSVVVSPSVDGNDNYAFGPVVEDGNQIFPHS